MDPVGGERLVKMIHEEDIVGRGTEGNRERDGKISDANT